MKNNTRLSYPIFEDYDPKKIIYPPFGDHLQEDMQEREKERAEEISYGPLNERIPIEDPSENELLANLGQLDSCSSSKDLPNDGDILTDGPGPENLKFLKDVEHVFFKRIKVFPPEVNMTQMKQRRGIWNAKGRLVYYVGQMEYYWFRGFRSGFSYEIVDYQGKVVMTCTGEQYTLGFKGRVKIVLGNGKVLGSMEQQGFSSIYHVKDYRGRFLYLFKGPCYSPVVPWVFWCLDEEFKICIDDGITEIGRIGRWWKGSYPGFEGDIGIGFQHKDDHRVKTLLLGSYFLIEFQYYRYGGNGFTYFTVLLIGVFLLTFVLSNCFGRCPEMNSPFIAGPELEN